MKDYYNELDPYCCEWLRSLIAAELIPPGDVDGRSIVDVQAGDLVGYRQCHFFAGIGGWPLALQLAGWSGRVWTGSCPCQPFSNAGQRKGFADERHLWPTFYRLIADCCPAIIFGEQVAGAAALGWLAVVRADLENAGYAVGAADLPAASVGAPHNRQRLFWVADAGGAGLPRSDVEGGRRGLREIACRTPSKHSEHRLPAGIFDCADPGSIGAADGLRRPVGQVRAFGNALVPQTAAAFIEAVMDMALALYVFDRAHQGPTTIDRISWER
jgi:DNA (cytosine-5)-methyltransferase 1